MSSGVAPLDNPYDRGYRDGWHDIHVTPQPRRLKRRRRSDEYALGYDHGRTDGATWGQFPEWDDFRAGPPPGPPQPLEWHRHADGGLRAVLAKEGELTRTVWEATESSLGLL